MKEKNSTLKTIIIMLFIAGVIVAGYFYIMSRDSGKAEEDVYIQTEISKLLERDLDADYPVTAREVLKLYNRIMLELYGGEVTEADIDSLVMQLRKLYSVELLELNLFLNQLKSIKAEITLYKENEQVITGYQIEKDSSAIKWTSSGVKYYRIIGTYAIKKKGNISRTYQEFLLCEQEGKWKILGWQEVDGAEMDIN